MQTAHDQQQQAATLAEKIAQLKASQSAEMLAIILPPLEKELAALQAEIAEQTPPASIPGDLVHGDKVDGDKVMGDKHVHHPPDPSQGEEVTLRHAYLHRLLEQCNQLVLSGVDPQSTREARSRLQLGAVYTALQTQTSTGLGEMGRGLDPAADQKMHLMGRGGRRLTAVEQVNRHPHLVLLGDPGSGKSTFLNFLILCLVGEAHGHDTYSLARLTAPLPSELAQAEKEERDPVPQPWEHGALLPVRIILRDFAARGLPPAGEPATAGHLWAFIEQELDDASLGAYAPYLKNELLRTGGLFCFDGLDEVPEADSRRDQIKQVVEDVARTYAKARVLVTSRTYAYQKQAWQLDDFESGVLSPFSTAQMTQFIDNWYAHLAAVRGADTADFAGRALLLKTAIASNARLRGLAERPLLLTLMASLHAWRGGNLPEKREALYAATVDLLLVQWEEQRVVRDAAGEPVVIQPSLAQFLNVDRTAVRQLLNQLAYTAHAAQPDTVGTADIPESDLVMGLLNVPDATDVPPQRLIEYLRDRAGLLLPRGVGVYTFPHRTFQEYLAACHLADHGYPDEVAELACEAPNRWREVALLAGAKAASGGAFAIWPLITALCPEEVAEVRDEDGEAEATCWGALLAGQVLIEAVDNKLIALTSLSKGNSRHVERVRGWLVHLLRTPHLPALERARAGRLLARLGDPRREAIDVDHLQFAYVPAGPFTMGEDEEPPQDYVRWQPQHTVTLPAVWLARWPITNAHYQAFMDDGGYADEAFWAEAKAEGIWDAGQIRVYTWRPNDQDGWETRAEPADYGRPFTLPNHPRVGVSWYEALAFTRWLTTRWRAQGYLPEGWHVTLPSEAEWEKGARGGHTIPAEPLLRAPAPAGGDDSWLTVPPDYPLLNNPDPARRYPWTGDIDPERANYVAAEIEAPSAVGCFPRGVSPVGLEEMGGNVAEWTRSIYDEWDREKGELKGRFAYPYDPTDGRELLTADAYRARVVRMGVYAGDETWSRCAYRGRDLPYFRYINFGCRVCVSPFSSPSVL